MEPLAPWRIAVQAAAVGALLLIAALRPMPALRIVALCVGGLVAYGMVQDQVSARMCPEYFTVGHQPIEGLENPTLLGIAWGFLGAWWGGFILGVSLALTATLGPRPRLSARELAGPLLLTLAGVAVVTLITGLAASNHAYLIGEQLGEPLASRVPRERHLAFFTVACAHFGTYTSAAVGGLALCVWAARHRAGLPHRPPVAGTP